MACAVANFSYNYLHPDHRLTTKTLLTTIEDEDSLPTGLNIEKKQIPKTHQTNDFDQYKDTRVRLHTFDSRWPGNVPVTKEELAEAGWFYTGKEDRVLCPWCRGVVFQWEEGDTGLGEHAKHFPSCPFVQSKLAATKTVSHNKQGFMDLTCVKAVIELGYEKTLLQEIEKVLQRKNIKHKEVTTDLLIDEIAKRTSFESVLPHTDSTLPVDLTGNNTNIVNKVNSDTSTPINRNKENCKSQTKKSQKMVISEGNKIKSFEDLQSEVKRYESSMTCKVCLDAQVGELFLPCRHLACCLKCSSSVRSCPVCRKSILYTIKVFL